MYTPGTLLRLAREERKLSLADAKLICRIRETALSAMETDRFDTFPAQYMQTFLPEYANFLGVSHARLAEAFQGTLPEYEYLVRSLYSRSFHQVGNNDEGRQNNPSPVQSAARFVRTNARKGAVAVLACCMLWFVFGSGASIISPAVSAMLAKAIVATPEDMRGTPFTELNGSEVPTTTRPVAIDKQKLERMNHRGRNFEVMKRDAEANSASANEMKVISLAAIVPLQKEMQAALEDGFEFVMRDEKAAARMRRNTSLASVSFAAAKARLEADAAQLSAQKFTNTSDDEAEEEQSAPETAHEASIEDVRKNADAASARISLILQTRITGKANGAGAEMQTQGGSQQTNQQSNVIRLKRYGANSPTQIDVVQLQDVKTLQTIEIAQPQYFVPVQLPSDLAQFYAGTHDLAQN